ncbi:hypothetical protein [Pseudomarimonas salicorniae]|uniref:Dolichyl-phosphate-mannose-protein mannosyltransferase n=1 Tax=Pseudomarimonas salicorniae TaxID=2933270 RepID=A0ABT0GIN9_9GAMM|nr:hypothetical protein [Lysobacter sp. CAU 1642]MCK7594298.1 hypothetical protein [Lysobacter sp. CAU 1642]
MPLQPAVGLQPRPAPASPTSIHSLGLLACCALGLALHLLFFWPGYVSFDVRSQLDQGLHGPITDVSPPANALLLAVSHALGGHGGALFALNAVVLWASSGWILLRLRARARHWLLLPLALPLLPLLPHLWTDLHLLAVLAMASALLLGGATAERPRARLLAFLGALLLVLWSTWIRQNALLAALPLALLIVIWLSRGRSLRWRLLMVALLLAAIATARAGAGWVVQQPVSVWAVTPLWDLQALSLRADRVLLPEGFHGPGLDVEELRAAYSPNTAVPLFGDTPSGVRNPTMERFDAASRHALLEAWVGAVAGDPAGWLAHRWTVFRRLFGAHRQGDLRYMVDSPEFFEASAPQGWRASLHQSARGLIERGKQLGVFAPGPAWLLGLLMLVLAKLRGPGLLPALQWALLVSALAYVLALFALTPSAEQRYLAWPLWATLCAAALALVRR